MTFHQREVPMPIERVDFANSRGQSLAALLELPDREPVASAARPLLHPPEGRPRRQAEKNLAF
jgi:hypothetical protein